MSIIDNFPFLIFLKIYSIDFLIFYFVQYIITNSSNVINSDNSKLFPLTGYVPLVLLLVSNKGGAFYQQIDRSY